MSGIAHQNPHYPVTSRRLWQPRGGFLFGLALLTCGCTSPREYVRNGFKVGPNYAKPAAPVEQNWIDAGDKRLDSRTTANVEWWTVLNDPVLNDLIKRIELPHASQSVNSRFDELPPVFTAVAL